MRQPLLRSPWIVLCAAFLLVAQPCGSDAQAATLWKWRDANGRITVSDKPPPPEVADRDILERPAAATSTGATTASPSRAVTAVRPPGASAGSGAASAPAPRVDPELEARRRAESVQGRGPAAPSGQEEAQALSRKRENCQRARAMLASLESGQRMARLNDRGERVVLDDAARAQEARRAREVIASDCF